MPVLETIDGVPETAYGILAIRLTDAMINLANGAPSVCAVALDALLRAQGIHDTFNTGENNTWRIATCHKLEYPGVTISEHKLAQGPGKAREGKFAEKETYGVLLQSFIHRVPGEGSPFFGVLLGLQMTADKIIQLVDLLLSFPPVGERPFVLKGSTFLPCEPSQYLCSYESPQMVWPPVGPLCSSSSLFLSTCTRILPLILHPELAVSAFLQHC
jgi:hypothetical protein